ncbi:SUKH-4 family immunity protein [Streptomyces sp. NPDC020898]|uniref:SUKH-4 family immunity protein n=1 Tax=Streptomyces sp. NPDC020898 TaxID=3365101 RepID=UPI0037A2469B
MTGTGRSERPRSEQGVHRMENHQYSASYVGRVQDRAAREFLTATGLPVASVLFTADEADGPDLGGAVDREVVRIGYDVEGEGSYYVDAETGAVLYVEAYASTEFHVSASPQGFAECLEVFERKTSETAADADPDELEEITNSLRSAIEEIDPSTLREDPGFWHSLLFDVANGDYRADEEE